MLIACVAVKEILRSVSPVETKFNVVVATRIPIAWFDHLDKKPPRNIGKQQLMTVLLLDMPVVAFIDPTKAASKIPPKETIPPANI